MSARVDPSWLKQVDRSWLKQVDRSWLKQVDARHSLSHVGVSPFGFRRGPARALSSMTCPVTRRGGVKRVLFASSARRVTSRASAASDAPRLLCGNQDAVKCPLTGFTSGPARLRLPDLGPSGPGPAPAAALASRCKELIGALMPRVSVRVSVPGPAPAPALVGCCCFARARVSGSAKRHHQAPPHPAPPHPPGSRPPRRQVSIEGSYGPCPGPKVCFPSPRLRASVPAPPAQPQAG